MCHKCRREQQFMICWRTGPESVLSGKQVANTEHCRAVGLIVAREKSSGLTLIELIVATAILITLTGMALPLARVSIKRKKERRLRYCLSEMRDAIDR
jgi:type II secretory pathway pseudopilin PulG